MPANEPYFKCIYNLKGHVPQPVSLVKEIFKYTMVNLTHVLRAGVKVFKVNQFNISKCPVDEKRRKSSVCLSSDFSSLTNHLLCWFVRPSNTVSSFQFERTANQNLALLNCLGEFSEKRPVMCKSRNGYSVCEKPTVRK